MELKKSLCPVCGFDLGYLPWDRATPSNEICPSCGIQYGYDDAAGGDIDKRTQIYKEWKDRWIKEGMPWKSN
jgi:hypothetical protein